MKILIGEQPYKQSLNSIEFAVDGKCSSVEIYKETENVAFLVSEWIKVQDSLEMIFNLMFGTENSLEALACLKKSKITPLKFSEFLWNQAKFILLNRHVKEKDKQKTIAKFIKNQSKSIPVNILFVGNEAESNFPPLPDNCLSACAIHPSGTNLNFSGRRIRYYDNWYTFQGKELTKKSENFSLTKFQIFK